MSKILFIQHAGVPGGSVKSLRQLVQGLPPLGFDAEVCLLRPSKPVVDYYAAYDIPFFINSNVLPVFHTSGSWMHFGDPVSTYIGFQGLLHWKESIQETQRIVDSHPCEIVHLNSSILLPCAFALHEIGQRFVWHVRESAQPRYFGNRLRFFRSCLRRLPNERIFLSQDDRYGWMGTDACGVVIPNSVDPELFELDQNPAKARRALGIPEDARCILYLGGFSRIKGIFELLLALKSLSDRLQNVVCLMPGTVRTRGQSLRSRVARIVLGGTDEMKALRMIDQLDIRQNLYLMPFQDDLSGLLQASDLLVFPATVPHFSMPVIEAAAAGKAVIASDFDCVRELVEDRITGVLVKPDIPDVLSKAIENLLRDEQRRNEMGNRARERAIGLYRCDIESARVGAVYRSILSQDNLA